MKYKLPRERERERDKAEPQNLKPAGSNLQPHNPIPKNLGLQGACLSPIKWERTEQGLGLQAGGQSSPHLIPHSALPSSFLFLIFPPLTSLTTSLTVLLFLPLILLSTSPFISPNSLLSLYLLFFISPLCPPILPSPSFLPPQISRPQEGP